MVYSLLSPCGLLHVRKQYISQSWVQGLEGPATKASLQSRTGFNKISTGEYRPFVQQKKIRTIVCYSMQWEWMMMGYVLTPNCKVDTALRRPLVTKHWHKCLAYQCEWEVKQQHARHAMNSESSWVLCRFVFAKAVQYCIHRTCMDLLAFINFINQCSILDPWNSKRLLESNGNLRDWCWFARKLGLPWNCRFWECLNGKNDDNHNPLQLG